MTIIAETLLPTTTHPGDDSAQTITGSRYRGDGFYNRSDGLHTVQWAITNFKGVIAVEATLIADPGDQDWFSVSLGNNNVFGVDTTGLLTQNNIKSLSYTESTTGTFSYNFKGNYVWVRVKLTEWTSGTVNHVLMSH